MRFYTELSKQEKHIFMFFILGILIAVLLDNSLILFLNKVNEPFKSFFHTATNFGNSAYYFTIVIVLFFILRIKKNISEIYKNLYDLNIFIFYNLLLSGIVVQLLKHLIGRPRPKMLLSDHSVIEFNILSFDSSFHSFPSGHSATIFSIVFAFYFLFPSIKKYLLALGIFIGLTRIVIGAHYLSDVIAGCGVSFFVFIFLRNYFLIKNKLFSKINNTIIPNFGFKKINSKINKLINDYENKIIHSNYYLKFFLLIISISIIFFIFPTIDITISGLFYLGNSEFFANEPDWYVFIFRKILLKLIVVIIVLLPIIAAVYNLLTKKNLFNLTLNHCCYLILSVALSLGLVVNVILKNLWGRVRPNDTVIFGGDQPYTIPWLKVSHCDHNCSFVSGDVSAVTLLLALILVYSKKQYSKYVYTLIIIMSLIRVMEGGHFFSDVLMSFMITFFMLKVLFDVFSILPENLNVDKITFFKKK